MITGRHSRKGMALADANLLAFCVQTEQAPYRYVSVEGAFTTRSVAAGENLHMAIRYLGEEQGRAYAAGSGDDDDNLVVSITPSSWLTVDYTKLPGL